MAPPVRFAVSRDGVRIAWALHGSGPCLIFVRGWLCHLDLMWADEAFRAFFEAIGRQFTVVRYDGRGNGLSDRAPAMLDLGVLVADLDAVVDQAAGDSAVLYAQCYGGPIALAYAARCPQRVSRLVIENSYACGAELAPPERRMKLLQALRDLPEAGLQLLASYTQPEPTRRRFDGAYTAARGRAGARRHGNARSPLAPGPC